MPDRLWLLSDPRRSGNWRAPTPPRPHNSARKPATNDSSIAWRPSLRRFGGGQFGSLGLISARASGSMAAQSRRRQKTTIPILSNVLLEASGDRVTLTATDLELGVRCSCKAAVKKEGAGTVPARKLLDYVRLLPEGDLQMKFLENHWVNIICGRSNIGRDRLMSCRFTTARCRPTRLRPFTPPVRREKFSRSHILSRL